MSRGFIHKLEGGEQVANDPLLGFIEELGPHIACSAMKEYDS